MSLETYKAVGVDFMIENRLFRQRLFWEGQLVSDISTVRPRISIAHRFATTEPAGQIEVRTFYPGGWLVVKDGRLTASQAPKAVQAVIWSFVAALGLISLAIGPRRFDPLVIFAFVTVAAHFAIRLSYAKTKRNLGGQSGATARGM